MSFVLAVLGYAWVLYAGPGVIQQYGWVWHLVSWRDARHYRRYIAREVAGLVCGMVLLGVALVVAVAHTLF